MNVNPLDALLLLSLATVLVGLAGLRLPLVGWLLALGYAVQLYALFAMAGIAYEGGEAVSAAAWTILGQELVWRYDALSWFFALITLGAALPTAIYGAGEWADRYREAGGSPGLVQAALALNVFAMLVLFGSGDFLSLFIAWEWVSWAGFLLMALARPGARDAALRYITYATAGAMALLAALALIHAHAGGFAYDAFWAVLPALGPGEVAILFALFFMAFGIKLAVLPFHLWQARAYAETPGPGMAFLGAISARVVSVWGCSSPRTSGRRWVSQTSRKISSASA